MAVVFNGENVGIAFPSGAPTLITKEINENGTYNASNDGADGYSSVAVNVEPVLQEKTATENGDVTPDEGYDGLSKVVVNVAGSGSGTNGLQWKCDNAKSLAYEFYYCELTNVDEALAGLDTSPVETLREMCSNASITSIDLSKLNLSNNKLLWNTFYNCKSLETINLTGCNLSNTTNAKAMCKNDSKLKSISANWNLPNLNTAEEMFYGCTVLEGTLDFHNSTGNISDAPSMFYNCKAITSLLNFDMYNLDDSGSIKMVFFGMTNIENLVVRNVRYSLTIGTTSYGTKLTPNSLVKTIQELWDFSSGSTNYTLSMGATNLAKLEGIYVKLVTPAPEWYEIDPNADFKKPCTVCESTEEGAMTIVEYATSKNWTLA